MKRRHFRLQPADLLARLSLRAAICDYHEFIAAGSIGLILPKDARDELGGVLQVFVALFMTLCVVHALEEIDIHHENGEIRRAIRNALVRDLVVLIR